MALPLRGKKKKKNLRHTDLEKCTNSIFKGFWYIRWTLSQFVNNLLTKSVLLWLKWTFCFHILIFWRKYFTLPVIIFHTGIDLNLFQPIFLGIHYTLGDIMMKKYKKTTRISQSIRRDIIDTANDHIWWKTSFGKWIQGQCYPWVTEFCQGLLGLERWVNFSRYRRSARLSWVQRTTGMKVWMFSLVGTQAGKGLGWGEV